MLRDGCRDSIFYHKVFPFRCISQYKLLKSGIDNKTLDTLKKNNNVTLLTVEKLCNILDCTPNDIVRFTKDGDER